VKTLVTMVILVASCDGAKQVPIANVTTTAPTTTIPTGWVAIPAPDEERLHGANYASDEWQVAIDHGVVTFTEAKDHEPDSGPPLPFTPKSPVPEKGRQHVVAVSDGFLVGYDSGEWGGALVWYSKDGTAETKLADENVRGLVAVGPELFASIEGLAHITISEGNVRWIEHAGPRNWRAGALTKLDGAPRTFAVTADTIYLLTTESLERVGKDHKAVAIQPMTTSLLYPGSMAISDDGEVWIGMRQFVVRLQPRGARFDQTWLVRESCIRATTLGLECVCEPAASR
jgi:hypothetical protein